MKKQIFVDLDGVLVDFVVGAEAFYGKKHNHPEDWGFHYEEDWGMSPEEFWTGLDVNFWTNLPWTTDAELILALVEPYDPVILTAPPLSGGGLVGKVAWIRKNLPAYFKDKRYLIGSGKQYAAHPAALLIDDKEENAEQFTEAGGTGILWPQPWNSNRHLIDTRIEWLQQQLLYHLQEDY